VSDPLTLLQVRKLKNSEIERKDASGFFFEATKWIDRAGDERPYLWMSDDWRPVAARWKAFQCSEPLLEANYVVDQSIEEARD
jgi:hypothetical protein